MDFEALSEEIVAHTADFVRECGKQEDAVAKKYGVQIRVIGDLKLLPVEVQQGAKEAMQRTKHHSNVILNICLAYSCVTLPRRTPEI